MQGKVKWFSEEKGYGYIVADDGREHYFNIRDIQGTDLPRNSDVVSFESSQGKKGPRATSVSIVAKGQGSSSGRSIDERATCPHCGKKMVPRIISYRGNPQKSVCPYCAGTYKQFSMCFIATAVYGDPFAPEVIALRRFRDETLDTNFAGRLFVKTYYRVSPPVANFLRRHPAIAAYAKPLLDRLANRNI